jgi:hypothetical protein
MSWLFEIALVGHAFLNDLLLRQLLQNRDAAEMGKCSHSVQLGAGRGDLLDTELTELGLELSELLRQIILVLAPELSCLDLARRLQPVSDLSNPYCSLA